MVGKPLGTMVAKTDGAADGISHIPVGNVATRAIIARQWLRKSMILIRWKKCFMQIYMASTGNRRNMSTRRGDAKDEDALRLPLAVGVRMNSTHLLSRPFSFQLV